MPRPLSVALRTRIVNACAAAGLFQVHLKTVEKLWKPWRTTHSVEPKPYACGRKPRLAPYYQDLRAWWSKVITLTKGFVKLRHKVGCISL